MNNHFFIYPKDKEGRPTGNTICVFNKDGKNFIGEAVCSKKDNFDKSVGRKLSLERAMIKAANTLINGIKQSDDKAEYSLFSDYRSDCDYQRYSGENPKNRSTYRVTKILKPSYKYDNLKELTVKHSPSDKNVTKAWKDLVLVKLKCDGNGLDVTVRDSLDKTRAFRLNYSQVHDLKLALKKYEQHYRTGKFTRVKA